MPIEMSDNIRDLLKSIPPADVRQTLRERRYLDTAATRITRLFDDDDRRRQLGKTGYDLANLDTINEVATVYSKSRATALGDDAVRSGSERQKLIDEGDEQADTMVAACRFQLGHIEGMNLELDAVAESTGALNLAVNLDVLAVVVENNAAKFEKNELFDAPAQAAKAREMATQLRRFVELDESPAADWSSRDIRNRASTLLWSLLKDLRTAAAFAFSKDKEFLKELRI